MENDVTENDNDEIEQILSLTRNVFAAFIG